jgi:hypothetical protein
MVFDSVMQQDQCEADDQEHEVLSPQHTEEEEEEEDLKDISTEISQDYSTQTDSEHVHELTVELQHESEVVETEIPSQSSNVSKKIPADDLILEFLQKSEQEVSKWLIEMNIACQIKPNVAEKLIQISARDSYAIDRFRNALDEQISTNELDPYSINGKLNERDILKLVKSFDNKMGVLVKYSHQKIFFCGFNENVDEAFGQCIDNL